MTGPWKRARAMVTARWDMRRRPWLLLAYLDTVNRGAAGRGGRRPSRRARARMVARAQGAHGRLVGAVLARPERTRGAPMMWHCELCGGGDMFKPRGTARTCSTRCRVAKHRADKTIERVLRWGWRMVKLPRAHRGIGMLVRRYIEREVTRRGGPESARPTILEDAGNTCDRVVTVRPRRARRLLPPVRYAFFCPPIGWQPRVPSPFAAALPALAGSPEMLHLYGALLSTAKPSIAARSPAAPHASLVRYAPAATGARKARGEPAAPSSTNAPESGAQHTIGAQSMDIFDRADVARDSAPRSGALEPYETSGGCPRRRG